MGSNKKVKDGLLETIKKEIKEQICDKFPFSKIIIDKK